MILAAGLLYLLVLILLGLWTLRRSRNPVDYFLAGGRLGLIPAAMATMASIMSGFVFVGGPSLFYQAGLGSFWITISSSFTGALMCWLLARPLHQITRKHQCLSIPDVILVRFGCRFSSGLAAVGILLGVIGYLATQVQALGVILSAILNVPAQQAVLVGLAVLIFYCAAGGMLASVYTDLLQGAIMLAATTLIFVHAMQAGGGAGNLSQAILEQDPQILSPWGKVGGFTALSWFLVFSVGSLGQPHVINKFMMLRDLRLLKFFPLVLAVSMILCGMIWLGVGFGVKGLVAAGDLAPLGNPDDAVAVFLSGYTPVWLAALAYAGILSAIMSTADSFVNVGAAALTRDLPRALRRRFKNELAWGRVFTFLIFGLAFLFALEMRELVAYLGIFAFGTFAAALTPALALGLNWPRADYRAARAGILFGIVSNVGLELAARFGYYSFEVTPNLLSLVFSLLLFLVMGCLHRPQSTKGLSKP